MYQRYLPGEGETRKCMYRNCDKTVTRNPIDFRTSIENTFCSHKCCRLEYHARGSYLKKKKELVTQ